MAKFNLGRTVVTPAALDFLNEHHINPFSLLIRHANGDWGELTEFDKQANENALVDGERILSSYPVGGDKVWIITEADRSVTTVLLPEDY